MGGIDFRRSEREQTMADLREEGGRTEGTRKDGGRQTEGWSIKRGGGGGQPGRRWRDKERMEWVEEVGEGREELKE